MDDILALKQKILNIIKNDKYDVSDLNELIDPLNTFIGNDLFMANMKQMIDVIQKIGKERKYTMILEKKSVLYHNTGNDLTALAIKTYDRTHK